LGLAPLSLSSSLLLSCPLRCPLVCHCDVGAPAVVPLGYAALWEGAPLEPMRYNGARTDIGDNPAAGLAGGGGAPEGLAGQER